MGLVYSIIYLVEYAAKNTTLILNNNMISSIPRKRHGVWIVCWRDDIPQVKTQYRHGQEYGLCTYYHTCGTIWLKNYYLNVK